MSIATLTSKGQITLPKAIRTSLNLEAGHQLEFILNNDGSVLLKPRKVALDDLYGMVKTKKKASLSDINRAIDRYHKNKLKT